LILAATCGVESNTCTKKRGFLRVRFDAFVRPRTGEILENASFSRVRRANRRSSLPTRRFFSWRIIILQVAGLFLIFATTRRATTLMDYGPIPELDRIFRSPTRKLGSATTFDFLADAAGYYCNRP
jgi:hypothetical protein